MNTVILILIVAGLVGAGTYLWMNARDSTDDGSRTLPGSDTAGQLETDLEDRSLLELQVQDIVSYYGSDYIVEGRIQYREDSWTWVEYRLEDGDDIRWLEAEQDDGLEVTLWQEVDDLHIGAEDPPEFLDYDGREFRLSERGRAKAQQEGRTGRKQGMHVDYFEYEGPGDRLLAVEKWGGDVEVSVGESVEPYEFDVLPGDALRG